MPRIAEVEQLGDLILARYVVPPSAGNLFVVHEPFRIRFRYEGETEWRNVTVPVGFETDLASVPRIARMFVSKSDAIEASVVHDYLYKMRIVDRETADAIFFALMRQDSSLPAWRARVMFGAVRVFGGFVYRDPNDGEIVGQDEFDGG